MTADFGPCASWDPYWICDDVLTESPAATGMAVSFATYVLWSLTGRQFGTCSVTLRPCRQECYDSGWWNNYGMPWTTSWDYTLGSWPWVPLSCGGCRGSCSCTEVSDTLLPSPVNAVTQVKIDGSVLSPTAYTMYNNRILTRTDGSRWPRCNDLSKDDTHSGTWSVTATYGQPVPSAAAPAVGELACEYLKAMRGEDCRLPAGITSIIREGVSIKFPDPGELMAKGRTGLYMTDAFIQATNPNHLHTRSRVYSPDRMPHRRPS